MPNLLIIIASTRPGRVGLPVARWFEPIAADRWDAEYRRFQHYVEFSCA